MIATRHLRQSVFTAVALAAAIVAVAPRAVHATEMVPAQVRAGESHPGFAPPTRVERQHVRERPGYVWVQAHPQWRRDRYVWTPGYWVRERPGYVFVQPRWEQRGPQWVYFTGNWERHGHQHAGGPMGDRDHDGVPNRYDRDRDGDGVANRNDRAPNNPNRR